MREPGIVAMVSLFLAFNRSLFFDTFRDIWHSLLVTVLLMLTMYEWYIDGYRKKIHDICLTVRVHFQWHFWQNCLFKLFILVISLEYILYNWNNTNMDYCYMHFPSQWEICWQSKTGINWVRQLSTLSSESSIDPSIGKWIVDETNCRSRQRLPEVSRLN